MGFWRAPIALAAVILAVTWPPMRSSKAGVPSLDFSDPHVVRSFRLINDGVMGGESSSRLRSTPSAMVFEGEVSLANNGGFA